MVRIVEKAKANCSECGKGFERNKYKIRDAIKKGNPLFCSTKCAYASRSIPDVELICSFCGVDTTVSNNYYNNRKKVGKENSICCSRECADSLHSLRMTGERNPNYGGTFHAESTSMWSEEKRKLASMKVSETMIREGTSKGSKNGRYKGERITYKCEWCGEETPPKSHYVSTMIEQGEQKAFCSESCVLMYGRNQLKGIRKDGGMTSIERKVSKALEIDSTIFMQEFPIGIYFADFYIPEHNVLIECDGDYWHSLPEVVERDIRKNQYYDDHGFHYIRLSETDINRMTIEEISEHIRTNGRRTTDD